MNTRILKLSFIYIIVSSILLASCSGGGESKVEVSSVSVSPSTLTLTVGGTQTLSATVSPSNADERTVSWSSSNTKVASVSSQGVVSALSAGSATITATAGGRSGRCDLTVKDVVVATGVSLDKTTLSLTVGEETTLVATVTPSDAQDKTLTWTSSNPSVASVEGGKVKALAAGSTSITVSTSNGKSAQCSVTVANKATSSFAKGADISWVTEMEKDSKTWKRRDGTPDDLYNILLDEGMNSIRLRVFVNPEGGWSGKEDVVAKAVRAKEKGMQVMIDFHYSDFFADPSRQYPPLDWKDLSFDRIRESVVSHTREVLSALSESGVSPTWIQIGNETRNGMLWDYGRLWNDQGDIEGGRENFVTLSNAAYDTAKEIFPSALVMPHLNNAHENNAWWFSQMKGRGLKFDMIALSHYPMSGTETWKSLNTKAVTNIKSLIGTFKVGVIVSEVGVKPTSSEARTCLEDFIGAIREIESCEGVFYWEPEVYGGWKPAIYNDVSKYVPGETSWNAYDMGAFTSEGKPADALRAFAD